MKNPVVSQVIMEQFSSVMAGQLGKRTSTSSEIKTVENLLVSLFQEILEESKKDNLIHSYNVEVVNDSPEIELIREVLEEPKDPTELEFSISMQLNAKIEYICLVFPLETKL